MAAVEERFTRPTSKLLQMKVSSYWGYPKWLSKTLIKGIKPSYTKTETETEPVSSHDPCSIKSNMEAYRFFSCLSSVVMLLNVGVVIVILK